MLYRALSSFLLIALLHACEKPVLDDSNLIPTDSFGATFTDTIQPVTFTRREDSLRTDELPLQLLGTLNDPLFGRSTGIIYHQLTLPSSNVDLGPGLVLDSAILTLRYAGKYGDWSVPQKFTIHELQQGILLDQNYFSNLNLPVNPNPIAVVDNWIANVTDSVQVGDSKLPPVLRIRLDSTFASRLLAQSGTANFANNSAFQEYLKGFALIPDTTLPGRGIAYFDMVASISNLVLYYKNQQGTPSTFSFLINQNTARVNAYRHSFSGSPAFPFINDSLRGDSILWVKSMSGLKAGVRFPGLRNLGNISIIKAELLIYALPNAVGMDSVFSPPARLTLNASSEAGGNLLVLDQLIGEQYFGGFANPTSINNEQVIRYRFNIARQLQFNLSNPNLDFGIFILTFPSSGIADRLQIGGWQHPNYPIKLNLTYTKIP